MLKLTFSSKNSFHSPQNIDFEEFSLSDTQQNVSFLNFPRNVFSQALFSELMMAFVGEQIRLEHINVFPNFRKQARQLLFPGTEEFFIIIIKNS